MARRAKVGQRPPVELLFGVGSPAAAAAIETARHLNRMTTELAKRPPDVDVFSREFEAAADESGRFHEKANAVVTQSWCQRRTGSDGWHPKTELAAKERKGSV